AADDLVRVLDASDRAVFVLGETGMVLFANARALSWFGGGDTLVGRPAPFPWSRELPASADIDQPDGTPRHLQRTITPATWGDVPASIVAFQDTTSLHQAEQHLRRSNRLHAALGQITATLARSTDEPAALEDTCRIAVARAGFRAVSIVRVNPAGGPAPVLAAAGAAVPDGLLHAPMPPGGVDTGPVAQAARLGAPCICNLISADRHLAAGEAEARRLDIASLAACPVLVGGAVSAVMVFCAREPGFFDRELVAAISQLTTEVAGALERFAVREQRQRLDTLRREAEQQLNRFRSLVESADDGFFIIDPAADFRCTYINDAGVRHIGRPREEMLTLRIWDWDANFTPETTRAFWTMLRDRGSTIFETSAHRPDGSRIRLEVAAHHLRTDDGEFLAGYFRDISVRARAEAELRESEERFRAVFEEASDALILVDPADHHFVDCNTKAVTLFEAESKARLLAIRGPELVAGGLSAGQIEANRAELAREGAWSGLLEYRTLHGRRFWGAAVARRITVGGRPLHILRITDTTDARRLLELVADTERLARIGGWEYHLDSQRIIWTDGAYLIHGVEPGTPITPDSVLALFEPGFREQFEAAAREGARTGQPWTVEAKITPHGRDIWIRILGNTELLDGRPHRLHGTIEDISEHHQAAATLRDRDERLQEQALLLDEASDAIIVFDAAGLIQVWNHGAERLLGWTHEEAIGRHAGTLHFPEHGLFVTTLAAAREHGQWSGELEHRTRDGTRVLVESRWTLTNDEAGRPRTVLTINTDITERKRREASRLRAQRLESIGTLAGGIAHDLNNILAPVVLSSDILRLRAQDPGDLELIDAIGASARRGAEIVRQVLSFARGVEGTHIPINIRHLLPEIRHIVAETFPKTISCRVEAPHDLWTVMGEPTQLHQVLLNLCLNSRDAMPEGGSITLRAANVAVDATLASMVPGAHPGPHVRLQVVDTGAGIAPELRERIFEPFFSTKGPGRGSGLGLSTAMAIVRSHRGFITLDSEPGRGTTVSAHFPAELPAGAATAVAPPAAPAESAGRGEVILVIDDEASVRSITKQSLESAGYRVLTAEDGARGISLFVQHREQIALVLTDIMMPVMDGVGVIKALRRIAPAARIIAVSGAADATHVAQSFSPSPAIGFLLKPFNLESLLRAVREALGPSASVL
ncbi:MAG: PAS domain S-box protein, partial [Opitutaceae bacterium]|nr:PAS domain S-box protein [Opitutaceae bacterium]